MNKTLNALINLYKEFKEDALCLDVETTRYNGPISLVGMYKPKDGEIDYISLIRGHNLSALNVKKALQDCKLLITYNGLKHDLPRLKAEFPNSMPRNIRTIDIFLLAKHLQLGTSLDVLENTLNIERPDNITQKGRAIYLWQRYKNISDQNALQSLLDYNRQDTINLYPIIEELIKRASQIQENKKIKLSF